MAFESRPTDVSLADPLLASPLPTLGRWLAEAAAAGDTKNPDAMALATADPEGAPSVRFVLCRGFDADTGAISFYTGYESPKARDLESRGLASVAFHWDAAARQARASGPVARVPAAVSDAYWASRPRASQIAARASRQSEPIASRAELLARMDAEAESFGGPEGDEPIPRPQAWGGYVLVPRRVELWVGSRGRAHDRARWERPGPDAPWHVARLQP